jgi:hypothetical protein
VSTRADLFAGLSRVIRRDPVAAPALTLTYSGAAALLARIAEDALVIEDEDGTPQAVIALEGRTLAQLVGDVEAALLGVGAVLVDDAWAPVLAEALLVDGPTPLDGAGVTFSVFTSPNWRLLGAVRGAVEGAVARLDAGMAQLNLLTADGAFADLWGQLTGTPRRREESSTAYTLRQLRELIRHRENNMALADLIEQEVLGVHVVDVTDLRPLVFVCSGSPMRGRPLAGRRYNAATCEVVLEGFPSVFILELARAHVAAGVTVFVRGTYTLAEGRVDYRVTSSPLRIGTPPPMVIGTGIVGVGQIGAT